MADRPPRARPKALPPPIRVERRGARLTARSTGRALSESEARRYLERQIHPGERLLQCVERDGTAARSQCFTFVLWPKAETHTGRFLRAA